jgi:hypothetical protein
MSPLSPTPQTAVLQASKARRLARLGVVITIRAGMAVYDYPPS